MKNFHALCLLNVVVVVSGFGDCPESHGAFRRVGETRFYINHPSVRGDFVTREEADDLCTKHGLKMPTVKNLLTMAVLGRQLEQLVFTEKLKDTWYWLDGKYDDSKKTYIWGDSKPLQFSLVVFRTPRPIGVGKHVDYNHTYQPDVDSQCLTLALPYPGIADFAENPTVFYGHQTTFDERHCESSSKRHAMCESEDPACDSTDTTPYTLDEGKEAYFYDGNWMFGNRKYFVNWKQRNSKDSRTYCNSLGLKLLTASKSDKDLLSYIKMWTRGVTVSQFWTSMKYDTTKMQYLDEAGKVVPDNLLGFNVTVHSSNISEILCVALSVSYELLEQTPCGDPSTQNGCEWSFFSYVPANCNNYHGSICQHKDYKTRSITALPINKEDLTKALETSAATSEFGFTENYLIQRSKYKQTFGLFYCPKNYRALRSDKLLAWFVKPTDETEFFDYEYGETYWVIDKDIYNKTEDSSCTVASIVSAKVKYKKVKCNEWHFYLCIKNGRRPGKKLNFEVNTAPPMEWKPGPQPRLFPIKK